jgi:Flp pilus assembly CpaF family ATPase
MRPPTTIASGSPDFTDDDKAALVARLRDRTRLHLAAHASTDMAAEDRRDLATAFVGQELEAQARAALTAGQAPPDAATEAAVSQAVLDDLFGLGRVQPLLTMKGVENIDVNSCRDVFIQFDDGRIERAAPIADSDADLIAMIRAVAADAGLSGDGDGEQRRFDRAVPRLSLRLEDGSRLFAVLGVSPRPLVSIRRHPPHNFTLADLVANATMTPTMAAILRAIVRAKLNLLIAGGTNTGKTELLKAVADAIDPEERLITIEDAFELDLGADPIRHPNVAALQAREANIEGLGAIDMAELVRWALRMNPHRVIVGEARGAEVVPLLNAMSQGNDGSLATIHASSSRQAFTRLATYAVQAPERLSFDASAMLIGGSVHFVVHLAWSSDGRRVVSSLREVTGSQGPEVVSNEVYTPGPDLLAQPATPIRAGTLDRLLAAGLDPKLLEPQGW